ncbi:WAT1-related protein At3g28050-like isoform X3 [Camellia sinensis]|uniref:WAT1-related protein At3g28050-like isoform X3 n=1 Tax=Camellia sinensis TaxID=4442 RepID=UPI0010364CAF|nr:WAT1-related protein At3g28050-like isoform X3 [Camellia sinensis]
MRMRGLEIIAILGIEWLEVGLNTISKAAMRRGMNNFIFNAYSTILGVLFLLPLTFFFHRYCVQMFMFIGIGYSSPTTASAMSNLTPAYTFILALIFRHIVFDEFYTMTAQIIKTDPWMEKLDMKSKSSVAKCIGTIISILGAFTVTYYKGPPIIFNSTSSASSSHEVLQSDWVIGGFLLAASTFLVSVLFIVQAWIIRDYPAELMVTLISSAFLSILSTTIALNIVKDPNVWKVKPDIELVTIVYSGIFMVSFRNTVQTWVVRKKGPVFVTMFKPLGMLIALAMGISFLGDTLYFGSVSGGVIIALGVYSVLWGKVEEEKAVENTNGEHTSFTSTSDNKLPLLQKKSMET